MSDYPDSAELKMLEDWPLDDPVGWLQYAAALWSYPDRVRLTVRENDAYDFPRNCLALVADFSTGGWSGNEDVIGAMKGSQILWSATATQWRRGGHWQFVVGGNYNAETHAKIAAMQAAPATEAT